MTGLNNTQLLRLLADLSRRGLRIDPEPLWVSNTRTEEQPSDDEQAQTESRHVPYNVYVKKNGDSIEYFRYEVDARSVPVEGVSVTVSPDKKMVVSLAPQGCPEGETSIHNGAGKIEQSQYTFKLPSMVDVDSITSKLVNGMLNIYASVKADKKAVKHIPVNDK